MLKIEQFVKDNTGKFLDDGNGRYKGQCVSLVKRYQRYVKWPVTNGNAIDQAKADKNYDFIQYKAFFVPRPSDIVVFRGGDYGHIGVVVAANPLFMRVFNQNYPKGDLTNPAQTQTFFYNKVVGFKRKK